MQTLSRVTAVLALLTLATTGTVAQTGNSGGMQAFVGATVVHGDGNVVKNAALVVRDGRVESIQAGGSGGSGMKIVRLDGKYILPGFISTHVHISDVNGSQPRAYTDENTQRQLGVFARYGITTVLSLGGEQDPAFRARDSQNSAALSRARLYLSGPVITGTSAEDVRKAVAALASRRPDMVKIRVDDNLGTATKMTPEVYRAVIDEAHKLGLRVAAHIFYLDDAKDLLRAGVDMIAHSVRDKDIDDEFINLMKARNVPYCPTLTREISTFVYESMPAFFSDPFFLREADRGVMTQLQEPKRQQTMAASASAKAYKAALEVAKRNVKKAADSGVIVVMGTDSGPSPDRFQGYFEHLEMQMMAESGLSPARVIRSATVDAAGAMKLDTVGALERGRWADFVVFDRNPLDDIRNTKSLYGAWVAGNQVTK